MANYRHLWLILFITLAVTFTLLGYMGFEIYRVAPPIPDKVVTENQTVLMTESDILNGQSAYQSIGGMQVGSIWGHGAYQAPDWTADWLHRELLAWLDLAAQDEYGQYYEELNSEQQALLQHRVKKEYRYNSYDADTGVLTVSERRAKAITETANYYIRLFGDDPNLRTTRQSFAMKEGTLPSEARRADLTQFFFWTAWAAATERPDYHATYTNNWPHEPLIDNKPTAENVVWSLISIVLLVAGVGFIIWGWAFLRKHDQELPKAPKQDPLSRPFYC